MEDSFHQTLISESNLSACLSPRPVDCGQHLRTAERAWPPYDGNSKVLSHLRPGRPCSICACHQVGP